MFMSSLKLSTAPVIQINSPIGHNINRNIEYEFQSIKEYNDYKFTIHNINEYDKNVIIIDDTLYLETIFEYKIGELLMTQQNILRDEEKIQKILTSLDIF